MWEYSGEVPSIVRVNWLPRKIRLFPFSVARTIMAGVLGLALLSGIVPFNAASSAHMCTMACCVSLPPHPAGSCHMSLSSKGEAKPEPSCDRIGGASHEHGQAIQMDDMSMMDQDATLFQQSDLALNTSTHDPSPQTSPQPTSIASQVLTKPCTSECGAGAINFMQGRRPHDQAILVYASRPRPPTPADLARNSYRSTSFTLSLRRPYRPRGPPPISS